MQSTALTVRNLQSANEDFEFYPTSTAMLEVVARDLLEELGPEPHFSILDVGAGNGNALETIATLTGGKRIEKYAIEKSPILRDLMPSDVFVLGTDFYEQTFIDKRVDVVFCNPPYSDFQNWTNRLVKEANARLIYMVIPDRWKNSAELLATLDKRCGLEDGKPSHRHEHHRRQNGTFEVLSTMSFQTSNFRKARATVDILKIRIEPASYHNTEPMVDPFDLWFEETFKIEAQTRDESTYERQANRKKEIQDLVEGANLVERLAELYREDMDRLMGVYRALESLDPVVFRELEIKLKDVRDGLRAKIKGLKDLYWNELFQNLDTITDRLTTNSRKAMLSKLTAHTSIDFTASNAYAVAIWAIKNANSYFDTQLCEVYKAVTDPETIQNYKSNTRLVKDDWRYERNHTHYSLDYRLVVNRFRCFTDGWDKYDFPNGLYKDAHDLLDDLATIGLNLGFEVVSKSRSFQWEPGKANTFYLADGSEFMSARAHKKGTVHIKMNVGFMRAFNVEAARLNGWIKSPEEAQEEAGIEGAEKEFGRNFKLTSIPLLLTITPEEIAEDEEENSAVAIEEGQCLLFA